MTSFAEVQYYAYTKNGSEKVQNYADVIQGWCLVLNLNLSTRNAFMSFAS